MKRGVGTLKSLDPWFGIRGAFPLLPVATTPPSPRRGEASLSVVRPILLMCLLVDGTHTRHRWRLSARYVAAAKRATRFGSPPGVTWNITNKTEAHPLGVALRFNHFFVHLGGKGGTTTATLQQMPPRRGGTLFMISSYEELYIPPQNTLLRSSSFAQLDYS